MMFFEDTRSIGLIFWIVAALLIVEAAIVLLGAFTDDIVLVPDYVTDAKMYCLVAGIGSAVVALLYAIKAHRTMSKKNTQLELLRSYVMVVGLGTLLGDSFMGVAEYLYTDHPEEGMIITGITIVLGIIIILMALAITNGKKGLLKKVIWVILAVSFTLMAIEALLPAENYWEYVEHVSDLIIAIFMLLLVADVEVRIAMGAKS